jgi:hypothetical protein
LLVVENSPHAPFLFNMPLSHLFDFGRR